jgi:hypothetical protein
MCNVCCKTSKALRPTQSLLKSLFNKNYTVPYDNNSMAYYKNIINIWTRYTETYARNETAPEPRDNKRANISKHIRSYVFVAWFSDLSVSIRIYSLACLYNLKAETNLASILKYIWFTKTIVQNGHSLQSKCGSGNMFFETFPSPSWAINFLWVTWPAPTRVFPQQEGRAWERGCLLTTIQYNFLFSTGSNTYINIKWR